MIQININVTDDISPMLAKAASSLNGEDAVDAMEAAGRAAVNAAIRYHREFDQAGKWKGQRHPSQGPNDGSDFGSKVAGGWHLADHDKDGATIRNEADHLAFKITGGTIVPRRAKYLTIPLVLEAKGRPVKDYVSVYQQNTGSKLFRPKGKSVLMEKTKGGGLRAVYALMKSVTMGPWPGASPDEDEIATAFAQTYIDYIQDIIK